MGSCDPSPRLVLHKVFLRRMILQGFSQGFYKVFYNVLYKVFTRFLQGFSQGFYKVSHRNSITAPGPRQAGGSGTLDFTSFYKGSRQSHDSDLEPCEMGWPVRNLEPCFTRFYNVFTMFYKILTGL